MWFRGGEGGREVGSVACKMAALWKFVRKSRTSAPLDLAQVMDNMALAAMRMVAMWAMWCCF